MLILPNDDEVLPPGEEPVPALPVRHILVSILVFITTIWGETFTFQFASHQSVSPTMAVTGPLEVDVLNKMLSKGCPSSFLHVQEHHHVPTGGAAQIEREVVLHDLLEADHVLRLLEVHVVETRSQRLLAGLLLLAGEHDEDDDGAGDDAQQGHADLPH